MVEEAAATAEEVDPVGTDEHLDLGAGLVQERRRLERALAAADHDDAPAAEKAEVALL